MAHTTNRRRIHVRSFFQKLILILAALAILGGIVLLAIHLIPRGGEEPKTEISAPMPTAEPAAEAEETPAPTPEPTPEPYGDRPAVDLEDWSLRLVNVTHPLPADFVPEMTEIENAQTFDSRAAMHLKKLIEDARADGYTVYVCSCYRSYDIQYFSYWNHVENHEAEGMTREEAEAATRIEVNPPGCSEHQLGLAADILEYMNQDMEPYIGGSGLMLWLEEHCMDYGFVIRYPDGKTDITGVMYEPWHLRYVGTCARYIMSHDLCLEEFLALYE